MYVNIWARRTMLAVCDALCWAIAAICIIALRFSFRLSHADMYAVVTFVMTAMIFQAAIGFFTKQYRNRYRIGSFEDVVFIGVLAAASAIFAAIVTALLPRLVAAPITVVLSAPLLAMLFMAVTRTLWRTYRRRAHPEDADKEPIFIIGAGDAGYQLVRQLNTDPNSPYEVVGLIDDANAKKNLHLDGVAVVGNRHSLVEKARKYGVATLLYAIHNASREVMTEYSDLCTENNLEMLTLPPISKVVGSKINLEDIRHIDVADLLGRRQVKTNLSQIAGYVTGKRVMVTGAGGSIGSEICRQVHVLGPSELILLDRDETSLHAMQLDLYGSGLLDTPDMVLCDIRDKNALRRIYEEHKPQVVFHTAALKHLPMLEQYPEEGWKTNTIGSWNLLDLADEFGVEKFVNISTDKAADATSVLGRTKRLAERLTAHYAEKTGRDFVSVRFGNVLGSRGSMLWTFRHQIEKGGPITVTHPDVERYFMTIPEACALVIQAGAIGRPGEVMVLDMGEPVKIYDVARRMIALSKKDIDIVITGLRPGEKLSEVLVAQGEEDNRPFHPLISHVAVPTIDPDELEAAHAVATQKDDVMLKTDVTPQWQPDHQITTVDTSSPAVKD
ncbi:MAG: nucleoside-diphosphate sugar epimerase/dehydratase [Actinomycetaceae bacterium]|nr:nucleoside-diphosphate sugar epimerase/dehydratase [Actinomycetaceae bacterium]MDO5747024.1 nucleoside-diphosphate sugar epimerase/dehydratase [Actinomycetaceae bacterium]